MDRLPNALIHHSAEPLRRCGEVVKKSNAPCYALLDTLTPSCDYHFSLYQCEETFESVIEGIEEYSKMATSEVPYIRFTYQHPKYIGEKMLEELKKRFPSIKTELIDNFPGWAPHILIYKSSVCSTKKEHTPS